MPYLAKWFPFGPILATIMCLVAIFGQNFGAFFGPKIDWYGVLVSYIGLPLFLIAYLGYKFVRKTKLVPYDQADFSQE